MSINEAVFRFYEELNDFLPPEKKKLSFFHAFDGKPSIKDTIESLGVPHTEIDLILVNGNPVDFSYQLRNGDRVAVYPVFESFDISKVTKLRNNPLREPAFILDVHLGKLARLLRMLGFDTYYDNRYNDPEIVEQALKEHRIILTRDQGLLKRKAVTHGYWIRSQHPDKQAAEVIRRFDLFSKVRPLSRCISCNGMIEKVEKREVLNRLLPRTIRFYEEFYRCSGCEKVFWRGSHYNKMVMRTEKIAKLAASK
ncbi:MAG: Mut7-C RNAse domain-containing protein [Spirochaetota bacterium]